MLNQAGRKLSINTSLAPMANHVMQTALLPQHIHKKIDRIKRNFFLGHQANTRKLHPINWKIVGKNKSAGGLGIRTSETMNKALILKRLGHP